MRSNEYPFVIYQTSQIRIPINQIFSNVTEKKIIAKLWKTEIALFVIYYNLMNSLSVSSIQYLVNICINSIWIRPNSQWQTEYCSYVVIMRGNQLPVSAARWQDCSMICFATFILWKITKLLKNLTTTKAWGKISTDYNLRNF